MKLGIVIQVINLWAEIWARISKHTYNFNFHFNDLPVGKMKQTFIVIVREDEEKRDIEVDHKNA